MNRYSISLVATILSASLLPSLAAAQGSANAGKDKRAYRHQWALIVGIDYKKTEYEKVSDRPNVNELINPEKDARDFSELLQKHYGYKKEHILMLLGRQASFQEIVKNLDTYFACHPDKVGADDSMLVYFAGHGDRIGDTTKKDRGYFIPADAEWHLEQPVPFKLLHFQRHIVSQLKKCPARHKLLILDCCHSGEIFNEAHPLHVSADRSHPSVFKDAAVQAIASCRGTQEAGDGRSGGNSPFLSALKRALTSLPARDADSKEFMPVTRMFIGMTPDFQYMPKHQSPSLRSLAGEDGEFHFFPKGNFDAFIVADADVRLMQAMIPGEHGNWWFEETPWMIPSLRQEIVGELATARTKNVSHFIHSKALRECAREAINKHLKQTKTPLQQMRFKHLSWMIEPPRGEEYHELLGKIVKDLRDHDDSLQAADMHFLAVLEQSLHEKKAASSYARALAAYAKARANKHPSLMEALCRADFGHYEIEVRGDMEAGIRQLNEANRLVEIEYGNRKDSLVFISPFCVFLRCRKADAWHRQRIWGEANNDLDIALKLARDLDKNHSLTSFVHRRRAWARMEQWNFKEAIEEFQQSNKILAYLREHHGEANVVSRVAELHNRHGLAMARRFQGHPIQAIQDYRQLVIDIGTEFRKQLDRQQEDFAVRDLKALLSERYVNSHERLVDCNLFGPPAVRDLAAAVDDARRGVRGITFLHPHRRSIARANLLFKQAIALSLPSPVQDFELARDAAAVAKKLFDECGKPAELEYQHVLTPPIVELYANGAKRLDPENRLPRLAALRKAIQTLENSLSQNTNRDHLEFLMFACNILLQEGLDVDQRYLLLEDAECLQRLCRKGLSGGTNETAAYLRPYYETVMKTRMQLNPKRVKELLEVQWEATMGDPWRVNIVSKPTLAIFVMDAKCYLFLDIPRAAGKVISLENDITCDELKDASVANKSKLRLPREIARDLENWLKGNPQAGAPAELHIHWRDPVHGLGSAPHSDQRPLAKSLECPFTVPENWRWVDAAPPAAVANTARVKPTK